MQAFAGRVRNPHKLTVRHVPIGWRFLLLRTGQKFKLLRKDRRKGRIVYVVWKEGEDCESSLAHSCHVKILVRPNT